MQKEKVYHVTMFGEFTITYQKESINVTKYLGKQLVNLFQVLLFNHNSICHKEELIEILWSESENPISIMKFTIFRLRKDLQKIPFFKDKEMIQTVRGGYQLNPEIKWKCDFDDFFDMWEAIKYQEKLDEGGLKKAMKIVNIYKAKFYVSNSQLLWAVNLSEFYRSSYVKTVIKICKKLIDEGKYEEMMSMNYSAIMLEPFYEGLHYYYMKGLLETNDYHKALKYYDDLNDAFLRELGTGLSDHFKELYDAIIIDYEDYQRLELTSLIQDICNRTSQSGGFYCTLDMFKYMYELSVKSGLRDEKKYFLISFEVLKGHNKSEEVHTIINKVKRIIATSLRNSDVFAKVNQCQFVSLVCCQDETNVDLIIRRISKKFYIKNRNKGFILNCCSAEAVLHKDK